MGTERKITQVRYLRFLRTGAKYFTATARLINLGDEHWIFSYETITLGVS